MITKEEAIKAYDQLIQLRRTKQLVRSKEDLGKVETHHILPTSCGGEDVSENRINLLAKEHFMAHVYLWAIHHEDEFHYKTMCALNMMVKGTLTGNRKELRDFILLSEEYQKAREEFAKIISQNMSQTMLDPRKNYSFGKIWIYHEVLKLSFLVSEELFWMYIGEGWRKGRVLNWSKYLSPEQLQLQQIDNKNKKEAEKKKQQCQKINLLHDMYEEFKKNEFAGVVEKFNYKYTRNNLIMAFKEYIPEYIPAKCNRWKNRKK